MLRRARFSDARKLSELDVALFPDDPFTFDIFSRELSLNKDWCWIVERNEEIVGYAVAQVQGGLLDLLRLAVAREHQGSGVGHQLLTVVLKAHPDVMLTVRKDNQRAVRMYHRRGMTIVGDLGEAWVMRVTSGGG